MRWPIPPTTCPRGSPSATHGPDAAPACAARRVRSSTRLASLVQAGPFRRQRLVVGQIPVPCPVGKPARNTWRARRQRRGERDIMPQHRAARFTKPGPGPVQRGTGPVFGRGRRGGRRGDEPPAGRAELAGRDARLPPHARLRDVLVSRIQSGEWTPSRALRAETSLANFYGSRSAPCAGCSACWSRKVCSSAAPAPAPSSAAPSWTARFSGSSLRRRRAHRAGEPDPDLRQRRDAPGGGAGAGRDSALPRAAPASDSAARGRTTAGRGHLAAVAPVRRTGRVGQDDLGDLLYRLRNGIAGS